MLETSARLKGNTWLHALWLGTLSAETGNVAPAAALFQQAMQLRACASSGSGGAGADAVCALALRNQAVLEDSPVAVHKKLMVRTGCICEHSRNLENAFAPRSIFALYSVILPRCRCDLFLMLSFASS